MKYKDIQELRVTTHGPVFTLSDFKTGKTFLFIAERRVDKNVLIRRCDLPVRSNLNEYGAASFNVDPLTDDLFCINVSKVFVVKDSIEEPPKIVIDKSEFRFGDPLVVGSWLYMVADMPDNRQGIIRYKLPELLDGTDPTQAKHELVSFHPGHFYGGLTADPSGCLIAFNTWMIGMAFDTASVVVMDVEKNTVFTKLSVNHGAALWPTFSSATNLWYYREELSGSNFDRYEFTTGSVTTVNVDKKVDAEVGDPYWIMGNQRYFVFSDDHIVYHTEGKLVIHNLSSKITRTLNIPNIDLLSVNPKNSNLVYFKSDGPVYKSIHVLNITPDSLDLTQLCDISYEDDPYHIRFPQLMTNREGPSGFLYQHAYRCNLKNINHTLPTIIWLHGGPAMRIHDTIDFRKQAFIEAGFNLFDLVYTGSGGLGRQYRMNLYNNWGIADVKDVLTAAETLCEMEVAKRGFIFLVGSSAGAYLALGALAADTKNLIKAAAVSASFTDPRPLINEGPIFEREYTKDLIPKDVPEFISELVKKKAHVAFFHGEADSVVSSNDARKVHQMLVDAGGRSVFHGLTDEGHSFKKANNICFVVEQTIDFFKAELPLCVNSGVLPE